MFFGGPSRALGGRALSLDWRTAPPLPQCRPHSSFYPCVSTRLGERVGFVDRQFSFPFGIRRISYRSTYFSLSQTSQIVIHAFRLLNASFLLLRTVDQIGLQHRSRLHLYEAKRCRDCTLDIFRQPNPPTAFWGFWWLATILLTLMLLVEEYKLCLGQVISLYSS
jgi:hypothetical protein